MAQSPSVQPIPGWNPAQNLPPNYTEYRPDQGGSAVTYNPTPGTPIPSGSRPAVNPATETPQTPYPVTTATPTGQLPVGSVPVQNLSRDRKSVV
jgi:hypothetical protein